jgi:hypothetical protein
MVIATPTGYGHRNSDGLWSSQLLIQVESSPLIGPCFNHSLHAPCLVILVIGPLRHISNPRKAFIGFRKTSYLRNCTILSKLLLGNGELASLAYGSFKELHKFAELFQGAGVVRGMFEAIWGSTKHGPTGSIATHPTDPRHSQGHIYWSGVDPGHSSVRSGGTNFNIPCSGAVLSVVQRGPV